jgi:glycosyltransferase involved in cell wall biosynthesis
MKKQKIVAVIPALNEEGNLRTLLKRFPRKVVDQIVVVDDGSRDKTSSVAKGEGAIVVQHGRNLGVGAAIKSGYSKALELNADIILVVAGDGQHDPREIPNLIKPILEDEADYVVGDRLSANPRAGGMPRHRYYGNRLLTYLTRKITKLDVKDSQCGYAAISRAALRKINLGFLSDRWGVPNDMLLECALRGLRVRYVPITAIYGGRKSYIRLPGFGVRLIAIMIRGILRYLYFYRGTIVFSVAGGSLIIIGLAYGLWIVFETITSRSLAVGVASVVFVATIVLTGVQLLVFGLLAEMTKMIESRISAGSP